MSRPGPTPSAAHRRAVELLGDGSRAVGPAELAELSELRAVQAVQAVQASASAAAGPGGRYVPYPAIDAPDFESVLAAKREFREHAEEAFPPEAFPAGAPRPADARAAAEAAWGERCTRGADAAEFELTSAQLIVRNFLAPGTPYNGLLLFHGVGVGKTCTAVTVAEQFADAGGHRNGVLVLTGPALRDNFKRTIFDGSKVAKRPDGSPDYDRASQCTGTAYTDRVPDRRAMTPEQVDARVARVVRSRYTFRGPGEFANEVASYGAGPAGVERIREHYSDIVLIVDEAHNLRTTVTASEGPPRQDRGKGPARGPKRGGAAEGGQGAGQGAGEGSPNAPQPPPLRKAKQKLVTPALRRVLRCADNVKLLLLTATPMFNRATDVLDLINLLLANDKRPSLRHGDIFDAGGGLRLPEGESRLRAACKGYVSYVGGGDPFSFPMRLGPAASRDPAVLSSDRLPTFDIRGVPIPPQQRLRRLEIVGSPLGRAQREPYLQVESRIVREHGLLSADDGAEIEGEDEPDGETDGTDGRAAAAGKSPLYAGMQVCNVAFPLSERQKQQQQKQRNRQLMLEQPKDAALPAPGSTVSGTLDGCFARSSGRPVQFEYRPGVPRFLAPPLLAQHAPKIAAVVGRVLKSRGVVLIYSRFLGSGLVPLAMALEHAGFARFEAPPLLRGAAAGGVGKGNKHPHTYAVISGDRDYRSDEGRAIAALKSPANREGAVVKAILVSDRGSEGIDLKYVREVHILEPWYHMNKLEQVVGRAARFCSHADLPLEERNLTVYYHASTRPQGKGWGPAGNETVDLRAYRLAELKQDHIAEVEKVLRSVAFDCALHSSSPGRRGAAARGTPRPGLIDVRTSQGVALRGVPLSKAGIQPQSPGDQTSKCGDFDEHSKPFKSADDSTYNPSRHAYRRATYKKLIRGYFEATGSSSTTFDALLEHVRRGIRAPALQASHAGDAGDAGDAVSDRTSFELDAIVRQATEVLGPRGHRPGRIIHRGAHYLFQPSDEDTQALTDAERSAPRRRPALALDVEQTAALAAPLHRPGFPPPSSQPQRRNGGPSPSSGDGAKGVHPNTSDEHALGELSADAAALLARVRLPAGGSYVSAAVDAVIDRLPHAKLVRLATACFVRPIPAPASLAPKLRALRSRAAASLRSGRLVVPGVKSGGCRHVLRSPYLPVGTALCLERSEECPDPLSTSYAADRRRPIPSTAIGAIVALPRDGRAVFKVLEERLAPPDASDANRYGRKRSRPPSRRELAEGGQGSGCVCHQSSVVTTERLRELIFSEARGDPAAAAAAAAVGDKRALCDLYEVVVRRHHPDAILRVAQ